MTTATEPVQTLVAYGEAYLMCRDLGHAWKEDETKVEGRKKGQVGTVGRVLGCLRCNMVRIDSFNYRGELLNRQYRQPAGYQLAFRPLSSEIREQRFKALRAALKGVQQDKSMDLTEPEVKTPDGPRTPRTTSQRKASRQLVAVG